MYIITNNKNVIIAISQKCEDNKKIRNLILDDYNIAYAPNEVLNVYQVEEVPNEVSEAKYCYTEEKGFYLNEDYKETTTEEDRISAIEESITNIELALTEIYEGGTE